MSEVFEGLVCKSRAVVEAPDNSDLGILVIADGDFQIILDRAATRAFSERLVELAESLSKVCGPVLFFRYDSRAGYRYSSVIEDGGLKHEFTERDEIFVLLDDKGYPLTDGARFRFDELDHLPDDKEYETCQNAIEAGIENLGFSITWEEIKEKIYLL